MDFLCMDLEESLISHAGALTQKQNKTKMKIKQQQKTLDYPPLGGVRENSFWKVYFLYLFQF